jgi:hypothetical protein
VREPHAQHDEAIQPTVRDALIGELVGSDLIYAGWRIPYRIASRTVIGLGVLFILVMTAAIALWAGSTRRRARIACWLAGEDMFAEIRCSVR